MEILKDRSFQVYVQKNKLAETTVVPKSQEPYQQGLVIPLRYEGEFFLQKTLSSLQKASQNLSGGRAIAILVVNARKSDNEIDRHNQLSFINRLGFSGQVAIPQFKIFSDTLDLVLLNYVHPELLFPNDQGVGLARKLGCDFFIELKISGLMKSQYIRTTDGDAQVPEDFFSRPEFFQNTRGLSIFPFKHIGDVNTKGSEAYASVFDFYLSYYRRMLCFAQSSFAFTALGSAIGVHILDYVKSGGFPKLLAGEDFYLCNKVAKISKVEMLEGNPIQLLARHSDRVPFGTGPRLLNWTLEGWHRNPEKITFENPNCFYELKRLKEILLESRQNRYEGFFEVAKDSLQSETLKYCRDQNLVQRLQQSLKQKRLPCPHDFGKSELEIADALFEIRLINHLSREVFFPIEWPRLHEFQLPNADQFEADMASIHSRITAASSSAIRAPVGGIRPTPDAPMIRR